MNEIKRLDQAWIRGTSMVLFAGFFFFMMIFAKMTYIDGNIDEYHTYHFNIYNYYWMARSPQQQQQQPQSAPQQSHPLSDPLSSPCRAKWHPWQLQPAADWCYLDGVSATRRSAARRHSRRPPLR